MSTKYDIERNIFNKVASKTIVKPMSKANLDRYASPRWPHLFPKEKLFAVAGDMRGKKVLEIGCGEGIEAVQLAYCGADVTCMDISDVSIDVGRQRAALEGYTIDFRIVNIVEVESLGEEDYDIVWCNLILHHVVDSLDNVMNKIHRALKPGGMFISREPIAYAQWLKNIRNLFFVKKEGEISEEQPFRESEFLAVSKYFPRFSNRHYRILGRVDQVTNILPVIRVFARVDNLLLQLPGATRLAGDVVMWAKKTE